MSIPLAVKKRVEKTQWYHQRFDGSPLYLFGVGAAEVMCETRKPSGTEANVRACFFLPNGKADWYLDMRDVNRGARVIVNLAKYNVNLSRKLLRAWQQDEIAFQKFADKFPTTKLKKLSDQALIKIAKEWYKLFTKRFTSSAIIDHFALGTDEFIASMVKKEIGSIKKQSEFTKVFSALTAPTHQSFINLAETELLKIAIDYPRSRKKLSSYQLHYFWLHNNYFRAKELPVSYFEKEIIRWRKSGVDLRDRYRQLIKAPRLNAHRKAVLIRKYNLSRHLRTLLKISEDFTWWQDERKRATFLNIHIGTKLLSEMAQRRNHSSDLMKYLLPIEIADFFMSGAPSVADLRRRQRGCCIVVWRGGHYVATGGDIKTLRRFMFNNAKRDKVNDIRGLAASVGKATGRARIIQSSRDIGKVKAGDILIAVMTRPDYIVGIKKAAAIVTNEGGITCHAAIVSRELGIPCVIGTKIATEIFKDGDLVEVNANHGVVRKI